VAVDPNSPRSGRTLSAARKAQIVMELRERNWSIRQIAAHQVLPDGTPALRKDIDEGRAQALYKSPSGVAAAIDRELAKIRKETREDAHAVRDMDLLRIDRLIRALWPAALGNQTTPPDPAAHHAMRYWFDRKAKIVGYDYKDKLDERAVRVQELQVEKWDNALGRALGSAGITDEQAAAIRAALARELVDDAAPDADAPDRGGVR
jgi:hypothetical protein